MSTVGDQLVSAPAIITPVVIAEKNTPKNIFPCVVPTVTVYGCGGAGINLLNLLRREQGDLKFNHLAIDTSTANHREDVNIYLVNSNVSDHVGSGKVRSTHNETISKSFVDKNETDLFVSDINIVLTSLSGGSGNVIAYHLIEDLNKRGKKVILITLSDDSAEADAENSLKAIQSFSSLAKSKDLYLPTQVYKNNGSRSAVNKEIIENLVRIITLISAPTAEIDFSDRMNFLNPKKVRTQGTLSGIHLLYVNKKNGQATNFLVGEDDNQNVTIYDAVIAIGKLQDQNDNENIEHVIPLEELTSTRVRFDGFFQDPAQEPLVGFLTSSDNNTLNVIESIKRTLDTFKTKAKSPASVIPTVEVSDGPIF